MASKYPGKRCRKPVAEMTEEQYRLHRIYINAKRKLANDRKRESFVGPRIPLSAFSHLRTKARKATFVGPPKPKYRNKKRSTAYYRKKAERARVNLKDSYVKKTIKHMFHTLNIKVEITPEMIEVKRQQLKLWRMTNV